MRILHPSRKNKKYVADKLAGILDEKKLRKLNDDRINHWLNKGVYTIEHKI